MSPPGDGFAVDTRRLRDQARAVDAVRSRFAAVTAASAHIRQDDQAYGLLCGWISGVLEGRHRRHDELLSYVEENLALIADGLYETAAEYDLADDRSSDPISALGRRTSTAQGTNG